MKEDPDMGYLKAVANVLATDGNAIVRTKNIKKVIKTLEKNFGIKTIEIEKVLPENQRYIELVT